MAIETEEHAKARGARILARLMGASIAFDGHHIVAPDPNGERAGHAISRAIQLAGLTPAIDHVNAHATGTSVGDVAEARAINRAVGNEPAVYASKSALGHSAGAPGAAESILTVLALRNGVIPPRLDLKISIPTSTSTWWPAEPAPATPATPSSIRLDSAATMLLSPSATLIVDQRVPTLRGRFSATYSSTDSVLRSFASHHWRLLRATRWPSRPHRLLSPRCLSVLWVRSDPTTWPAPRGLRWRTVEAAALAVYRFPDC